MEEIIGFTLVGLLVLTLGLELKNYSQKRKMLFNMKMRLS